MLLAGGFAQSSSLAVLDLSHNSISLSMTNGPHLPGSKKMGSTAQTSGSPGKRRRESPTRGKEATPNPDTDFVRLLSSPSITELNLSWNSIRKKGVDNLATVCTCSFAANFLLFNTNVVAFGHNMTINHINIDHDKLSILTMTG